MIERIARERGDIPRQEIDCLLNLVAESLELFDQEYIANVLRAEDVELHVDPCSDRVSREMITALEAGRGWSAVRIGDAEAELLGLYENPNLNHYMGWLAKRRFSKLSIPFDASDSWVLALKYLNEHAVDTADVVGVLGLWRPELTSADSFHGYLLENIQQGRYMGWTGQLLGRQQAVHHARSGRFHGKLVTSAHLYFGVVAHMGRILSHADKVLIINDKPALRDAVSRLAPNARVQQIVMGMPKGPLQEPRTMLELQEALPADLRGWLVIVGMGLWANPYCAWAKQRGGVAVDLGSGCDLLLGEAVRPVHRSIDLATLGIEVPMAAG